MVVALVIACFVRPDPKRIGELLEHGEPREPDSEAAPLRTLLSRPCVVPALVAAQASFAVMVAVMTLTGAIVVDHQHHGVDNVFLIIGAHVIGDVRAHHRRRRSRRPHRPHERARQWTAAHGAVGHQPAVGPERGAQCNRPVRSRAGLGWNVSYFAATAVLADCTEPSERGKLLGFTDLLAGLTGAGLALIGGVALTALGVAALAIGGTALVAAPALWILRSRPTLAARVV